MALAKEKRDELEAKLKELRTREADREQAEEDEQLEYNVQVLELVETLSAKHGKPGKTWALIETAGGPIAVVVGDAIHYQKFRDARESDAGLHLADMHDFIMPNIVHPSREDYVKMCNLHAAIPEIVWPTLSALYRGVRLKVEKK